MLLVYLCVVLVMVNMRNSLERLELSGDPDIGFYVDVNVGTPSVLVRMTSLLSFNHPVILQLRLLVDTGSSNLVVAGPTQTLIRKFDPAQ